MAKESGIGATLTIDDSAAAAQAVTNDIQSVTFDTPRAEILVPGLDVSAQERLLGLADFTSTANGTFNDAATTGWFTVISDAANTDVSRTWAYALSGNTLTVETNVTAVNYARGTDGSMTINASFALQDGTDPTWS